MTSKWVNLYDGIYFIRDFLIALEFEPSLRTFLYNCTKAQIQFHLYSIEQCIKFSILNLFT